MKAGDLVEFYPEFLEEDASSSVGILVRPTLWDDGYGSAGWWLILINGKLIHTPPGAFKQFQKS